MAKSPKHAHTIYVCVTKANLEVIFKVLTGLQEGSLFMSCPRWVYAFERSFWFSGGPLEVAKLIVQVVT